MTVQDFTFTDGSEAAAPAEHYFTIAELRAFDPSYADTDTYPDALLEQGREWAEQRFEKAAGVAFVPRTVTETLVGTGRPSLITSWPALTAITACSIDGVALTADELAHVKASYDGRMMRAGMWPLRSAIEVTYTHGYTAEVPGPVVAVVKIMTRDYIVEKTLASRAVSESTDVGFLRLSIAAPGGRIGIPEADAVAADYGWQRHGWVG